MYTINSHSFCFWKLLGSRNEGTLVYTILSTPLYTEYTVSEYTPYSVVYTCIHYLHHFSSTLTSTTCVCVLYLCVCVCVRGSVCVCVCEKQGHHMTHKYVWHDSFIYVHDWLRKENSFPATRSRMTGLYVWLTRLQLMIASIKCVVVCCRHTLHHTASYFASHCIALHHTHLHTHCITLHHTHLHTHCNTLHDIVHLTASHCITQVVEGLARRSADNIHYHTHHCNVLQHTAPQCDLLYHTALHCNTHGWPCCALWVSPHISITATHCNTLQHTAASMNDFVVQHERFRCHRHVLHCHHFVNTL